MPFEEIISGRYPKSFPLRDGGEMTVRPLVGSDQPKLLEFFHCLQADDRMFLRDDVLNEAVVERWCKEVDYDRVFPLVACVGDRIVADATLHRQRGGWRRHLGLVRVVVDPEFRARGVASNLIQELADVSTDIGLDKLVAEFTVEQESAVESFQKRGFVKVATLPQFALDLHGASHDLVLLVYELRDEEYYAGD